MNLTPTEQIRQDVLYYLEMASRAAVRGKTAASVYFARQARQIARREGFTITDDGEVLR